MQKHSMMHMHYNVRSVTAFEGIKHIWSSSILNINLPLKNIAFHTKSCIDFRGQEYCSLVTF